MRPDEDDNMVESDWDDESAFDLVVDEAVRSNIEWFDAMPISVLLRTGEGL